VPFLLAICTGGLVAAAVLGVASVSPDVGWLRVERRGWLASDMSNRFTRRRYHDQLLHTTRRGNKDKKHFRETCYEVGRTPRANEARARSAVLLVTLRYATIDKVWYGMVWYGMVWYGMVWYGMVWYGTSLCFYVVTWL
jgi:hypothetical protein